MSGPKYSKAEIEAQRVQKMIEELKRTIEENKKAQLQQQIKNEILKLENESKRFMATFDSKFVEFGDKYIPEDDDLALLKKYISEIYNVPTISTNGKSSDELADILAVLTSLKNTQRGKVNAVKSISQKLKPKINEAAIENNVDAFVSTEFEKDEMSETMLSHEAYSLYLQLIELLSVDEHFEEIKNQIDAIIANHNLDESYKKKQLKLRIESQMAAAEVSAEIISLKAEISVLLAKLSKDSVDLPDSLDELVAIKNQLEAEAKQAVEDEYISASLSEVLEEIGYTIDKSETVRTSKRISHKNVCDFSNDSILQASTSTSGAVMFEVMSRKESKDITPIDKAHVKADMEHFCPDYQLIKAGLAKKGITLTDEQLSEPSEKYVRGSGFGGKHNSSVSSRRGKKEVKHNVFN